VTRDELIEIIRAADPVGCAAQLRLDTSRPISWTRATSPDTDADIVPYGTQVPVEVTADRILELAARHDATGNVRAVSPVPADGSPGSWGVQDLAVIVACRRALPDVRWIRPAWEKLGPSLCQIAIAFGANDWVVPADERVDPEHLAAAVGRQAVER
jgi:hypothetical protein